MASTSTPHTQAPSAQCSTMPGQYHLGTRQDNSRPIELPNQGACIHTLFEQQVQRTPDAIALITETTEVTYQQLNQKANALAQHLSALGVGPNHLVGISMERSIDMVVGTLGILKAGGAYVPIDPHYPPERIGFILQDTQVKLLLCHTSTEGVLKQYLPHGDITLLCVDRPLPTPSQSGSDVTTAITDVENLMYVIYTSGSTGRPKGVMIAHNGVCSRLSWLQKNFPLCTEDRLLQTTSLCFDPSVLEIFRPLAVGAQIVLIEPDTLLDAGYFINVVRNYKISVLSVVPSLLRVLLDQSGLEQCQSLKRIFCGGEALPLKTQQRLFQQLPEGVVSLHNLYGPTEASIMATAWTCQSSDTSPVIPIGYAVDDVQVYILDDGLSPVASGEVGEIYIGGVGLAQGYLNRPELTAEHFSIHPSSLSCLYRTKDLGKYLPNGALQFMGRVDQQVKIRGFRIELGEIESCLEQHPAIVQTAVAAWEVTPGQKRLCAYIVTRDNSPNVNALRSWLQTQLPSYMVPAQFVVLAALPLNVNGKLDRNALPKVAASMAPEPCPQDDLTDGRHNGRGDEQRHERLRMDCQRLVAKLLCLQSDQLDSHANLNHLGLDSLLAMQLKNQVKEVFHADIAVSKLMTGLSIDGLTTYITSHVSGTLGNASLSSDRAIANNTNTPSTVQPLQSTRFTTSTQALDNLDQMTDQDLDDLLRTLLPS